MQPRLRATRRHRTFNRPLVALGACVALGTLLVASCDDETTTAAGGGGQAPACGTDSPIAIARCVEQSRYEDDLRFVAAERPPGSPHHQAVQDLCAERFEANGFTVERHMYGTGTNVVGVLPGTSNQQVIVSAHYDHIPGCAGADDNATGVAGLLETARVLSAGSYERTLVVACWDEEESGLIGADAYAQRAAANGDDIAGVVVYEMLGYAVDEPDTQELPFGFDAVFSEATDEVAANDYRGDFIAVIGDVSIQSGLDLLESYSQELDVNAIPLSVAAALKNDAAFRDLQRSDHAPFWRLDIPALFITDTSEFRYKAYHCRDGTTDIVDNLNHDFTAGVIQMTSAAVADMLGVQSDG